MKNGDGSFTFTQQEMLARLKKYDEEQRKYRLFLIAYVITALCCAYVVDNVHQHSVLEAVFGFLTLYGIYRIGYYGRRLEEIKTHRKTMKREMLDQ